MTNIDGDLIMESDGWSIEVERLKRRVQKLESDLEESNRREEQTAKLNGRLLEALNAISQEEDRNVYLHLLRNSLSRKSNSLS